jgi:hypothetical protein
LLIIFFLASQIEGTEGVLLLFLSSIVNNIIVVDLSSAFYLARTKKEAVLSMFHDTKIFSLQGGARHPNQDAFLHLHQLLCDHDKKKKNDTTHSSS